MCVTRSHTGLARTYGCDAPTARDRQITTAYGYARTLDFGRHPNTRTVASLEDFLDFLSANDHIRRQIRRLFLRGFGPSRTERHVRPQLLTAIVDILPRLACLELSNVCVKPPARNASVHTWPIVARALPQLTVKMAAPPTITPCPTPFAF